jgi:arginine decarboxylase
MKNRYLDLIDQTFDFPQEEFQVNNKSELTFHNIPLMELIEEYGTPLKFTYLPKIDENIAKSKQWFADARKQSKYKGKYHYCYCSKSSHFRFVIERALANGAQIETSSAFDIDIIKSLASEGKISKEHYIICNGFKTEAYLQGIADLINSGFKKCYPVLDNFNEIDKLVEIVKKPFDIGIRIASEEEPKFEFYTSRLGVGYKRIVPLYLQAIQNQKKVRLRMLHFFINTGISDSAYYWNELHKCLNVYVELSKVCPTLNSLNIGGGFPIKRSLSFNFDYKYMVEEIVGQIKQVCDQNDVNEPDIFTEFGSFTVGESGGILYKILQQKQQNDREQWNMIDGSFMTTLPDSWAINHRFILLPINRWKERYERVLLGGLTCDSDDYYNAEQHVNAIYLPKFNADKPLYIGFFNTGAYQESLSGYGGIKHCLIPGPRHIIIDQIDDKFDIKVFSEAQKSSDMMHLLGYNT